ncbi:flavin monoamine oxidase family protein [Rhizobium leguminosarum]|uniref:flavin monoamine oxidase family protein n=1 Tax=Rhizobium TaxID=379 RepID=UPI001C952F31|nr:FAD-dependent oxidoreductase [Rhizobium leguminosarum]MBY5392971.1 FAD-dependent oxidoreductase [Rhizobium leguminosarum]MBY5434410.1 FAD-dependent oxidoreductase [Rhizobium leguminosarum]
MSSEIDVVIVGAGAAGIAASRQLAKGKCSAVMVEALPRPGGRAWTTVAGGYRLDLGCGWLHSADRNPWSRIAEENGFAVDRREAAWGKQFGDLGFLPEEQRAARQALQEWEKRLPTVVEDSDCAGDALTPENKWNPYVQAICGFSNGVAPDLMSASDYLAYDAACTYRNWRVPDGYGSMITASIPSQIPVWLDTPIHSLIDNGRRLKIETSRGSISARAAIMTVSTNVLAGDAIKLPGVLDPWRHAAGRLPLGHDEKLFLNIHDPDAFSPETHLIGNPYDSATCDFYIRPFGRPIVECYLGGDSALIVARHGLEAGYRLAIDQLAHLLGSDIRSKLSPLVGSSWCSTDRIGGAYSCALPGQATARRSLARSWDQRIFFAGEATHSYDFSTAHGAYESGLRAADEALAALNPSGVVFQPLMTPTAKIHEAVS